MSKKIQFLVIHCTATPEGRAVSADSIALWHRGALKNSDGTYTFLGKRYSLENLKNQKLTLPSGRVVAADKTNGRGWSALGYTDMILLDGEIVRLTVNNEDNIIDTWEVTNGVAGINQVSRHIVYAGGTDASGKAKDTRTPQQKSALGNYVLDFVRRFPEVQVAGHYQFAAKACPSFDVPSWCRQIGVPEKNIKS